MTHGSRVTLDRTHRCAAKGEDHNSTREPASRSLARRIRELAHKKDLTLCRLADRADIARSHLYRILNGQYGMSHRALYGIARALDVSPAELVFDGRPREGCEQLNEIIDVCNRLSYDGRYRVLCYARYEESLT